MIVFDIDVKPETVDVSLIVEPYTTEQEILLGDVNGDGKITAKDSMSIQRYTVNLTKLSDDQLQTADVNGDGKVTAADALNVLRYTVNINVKYPIGELIKA